MTLEGERIYRPTAESAVERLAGGPRDSDAAGRSCRLPVAGDLRWRTCSRSRSDPSRPCGSPEASRGPIDELRGRPQALGRREAPQPPDTSIPEIRDVAVALVAAAEERHERRGRPRGAPAQGTGGARDGGGGRSGEGSVLAVLSHELRTPLNAVYGWARMLRAGQIQGEADVTRAWKSSNATPTRRSSSSTTCSTSTRITSGKMRLDVRKRGPEHRGGGGGRRRAGRPRKPRASGCRA